MWQKKVIMKIKLKEDKEFVLTMGHQLGVLDLELEFCCVSGREASLKDEGAMEESLHFARWH